MNGYQLKITMNEFFYEMLMIGIFGIILLSIILFIMIAFKESRTVKNLATLTLIITFTIILIFEMIWLFKALKLPI